VTDKAGHSDSLGSSLSASREMLRKHAANLVEQQRSSLQSRIHALLGDDARRLTGTDDILSTASRRIDRVIMNGKLRAETNEQIYAFVHAVIERSILEKARSSRRLTRRERVAQQIIDQQNVQSACPKEYSVEDVEQLGRLITNPIDREIVLLRGRDQSFNAIAAAMQMDPAAVRVRWARIRQRVRGYIEEEFSE